MSLIKTETNLNDLPETLRQLRKRRGLTLKEASGESGVSPSYISDIERGRTIPTLETIQMLAAAYNTLLLVQLGIEVSQ